MSSARVVEVFSAGCAACDNGVELVRGLACPSCEVRVVSMADPEVAARAASLGIQSLPAVVIDGVVAGCCSAQGLDESILRSAGLGSSL